MTDAHLWFYASVHVCSEALYFFWQRSFLFFLKLGFMCKQLMADWKFGSAVCNGNNHWAEIKQPAQQWLRWRHRNWSSAMLNSQPHLADGVNFAAVQLPVLVFIWLPTVHMRKQDLQAEFLYKHSKRAKWKGNDLSKETLINYNVSSWRVCAITSFEGFVWNQMVLFEIKLSFTPLLCALCSAAKFCKFYDWLKL